MNLFRVRATLSFVLIAALAALPAQPAAAQDGSAAAAYCQNNPQACEKARGRIQELKAKCDADPAACEEKKAELQKRREELKAKCDADPAACAQKKQAFRDRLRERRDQQVSPAGQTPPIIPPTPDH